MRVGAPYGRGGSLSRVNAGGEGWGRGLSEQELVDCDKSMDQGCSGAWREVVPPSIGPLGRRAARVRWGAHCERGGALSRVECWGRGLSEQELVDDKSKDQGCSGTGVCEPPIKPWRGAARVRGVKPSY